METCDISLVKKEIVELIKTEPHNEDEFDMFGQSGIKTEDSNLVGDFKDTINFDRTFFQTSDVEIKSPWDGFLTIKEQIKDEYNTSNSIDEIVKNEIMLYDSSFGIVDSKIDHFKLDKSEKILEQDQFILYSEILQSNIIAQSNCDFNLNIECINENQDLSFNALHKKAVCRNLSIKRLSSKFHKNIITEYRTSFLNSDQTKYVKKHNGAFSDNVYNIKAFSDNHLLSEKVIDNVEINISIKNTKLMGFCISTEAPDTKSKFDKYTKKGVHCMALGEGRNAHGGRRKCKTENCTKNAQVGGHCIAHGGGRKCKTENCTMNAQVGGHCRVHSRKRKCKTENCSKNAQVAGHCKAHGGRRKCKTENCTKSAKVGGLCIVHRGGKKCKTENCTKNAKVGGNCIAHGGSRKFKTEDCTKSAQVGRKCMVHGGRMKCRTENCTKNSRVGGYCIGHGGGRKCKTENCIKNARVAGHCRAHGGGRKCKTENFNCTKCA